MWTADEWLVTLFARLDLLTRFRYKAYTIKASMRCHHLLRMCMLKQDTTEPDFLPSRIACGLFVHSLVAVRLLPVGTLQPTCVTYREWETLFAASQPEGSGSALPRVSAAHDCPAAFVQYLKVACGTDLATLQRDSFCVAGFMRDGFEELRISSRARGATAP